METTCVSINRGMVKKMRYIYTILGSKKEWHNAIFSNMRWPRDCHTQSVRKRKTNIMRHRLYVEFKTCYKRTYLWDRNRITDIENKLEAARGEVVGGGMEWEIGVSRRELLYKEWRNSKVLLCSTGNCIQYPMINDNENNRKKERMYMFLCIYIYIYLNHFIVEQ